MNAILTQADVKRLLTDRSPESRTRTAEKVAIQFGSSGLSEKERRIAEDIFRIMVRDAEVRVREALSSHLKDSPLVPRDVAVSLAKDVDSVALPILESSEVLSDEDLLEIIRSHQPTKQVAIARRRSVSAPVADALVDTDNREAVAELVSNEGAELTEQSLAKVVEHYADEERIQDGLVHRADLPITIAERLVSMVSESLRNELIARRDINPTVANDLLQQSREQATVGLATDYRDVERLVYQLRCNNRLTPSFILRALCTGDLGLFEACIAQLAGISIVNARRLIYDKGPLGLKAAYDRAGLPLSLYPAFRVAVNVATEMEFDGNERDRERYVRRMIERILTQFEDLGADNLEYLLTKLSSYSEAGAGDTVH